MTKTRFILSDDVTLYFDRFAQEGFSDAVLQADHARKCREHDAASEGKVIIEGEFVVLDPAAPVSGVAAECMRLP